MVRLMTYNIQEGGGPESRCERLLAVIDRVSPDVLVINEAKGWFPRHPFADRLAEKLGAEYRIARSANGFDVAIFTRFPVLRFAQPAIEPMFHALAWVEVTTPTGTRLNVVGAHLDYREESRRVRETEAILPEVAPLLQTPTALLGDFNALSPDDPVMGLRPDELGQQDLSEMPDWFLQRYPPETLPRFAAAGWNDAYRLCHAGRAGYTMSTSDPNARYDYILLSPPLVPAVTDAFVVTDSPATNASDHFAVVADLAV